MKRINYSLFLIRPLSQLTSMGSVVSDFPIRRLDQWTEVLRLALHPRWVLLLTVKNINFSLFLIRPLSEDHLSQLKSMGFVVSYFLIRRLDQWMEALRPVLHPSWVCLEGISLHAWDERISTAWVNAWW